MKIPNFANKNDLFGWLKANKTALIAEKKYYTKHADAVVYLVYNEEGTEAITKAISDPASFTGKELKVSLVINTTNIMDSHSDVHLPGIWNKSVKENKNLYLLQEHDMSFKGIISDEIKAKVKSYTWKELGYDATGNTQALVFNSTITKERNEYMFEQYLKGRVKNHSVGMRYVNVDLALNSESKYDTEEKALWDKYINVIVNKEAVEEQGYFFPVTEAKVLEGSAVVIGSNQVTPTLEVSEKEPPVGTHKHNEPDLSTHKKIDYKFLKQNLNLS